MTISIGAVLRSTGLATIDRALQARADRPRVKVWAGSIAVGQEQRVKAYTPIRSKSQINRMLTAVEFYEMETLAARRSVSPRARNGAVGQNGLRVLKYLTRVINYRTGALFPSLETIVARTLLSKSAVVDGLARLKESGILDWFRRYKPVPEHEAEGPGPRVKQATNAYRFLFPAFLAEILKAHRSKAVPSDASPACEQYRRVEVARELDRMMDQLPLWELPPEQRSKRELAAVLASLGAAIEAKERESLAR